MMKRKIAVWVVTASVYLCASTLNVDDLVGIALRHSPDIAVGHYNVQSARQHSRSVESARLPQLGLSVHADREYDHYRHSGSQHFDTLEGTLSASQLLYDFGKSAGEIEAAHQGEMASRAQMQQLISDKIFEVKQRYYDTLKAKTLIWVYEKNYKLQKKHLYRAKKYLKAGIKTIIDVTDAKLQMEQARRSLTDASYLFRVRRTLLEESLGTVPEHGEYTLYMAQSDPTKWQLPKHEAKLDALLQYAQKHRPVLLQSEHDIMGSRAYARSKSLHYTPKLELYGEAGTKALDPAGDDLMWRHEKAGVRMNWSLFSGYRESAEAEAARIDVMKAYAYKEQTSLAIRREVTQAYLNLQHMRENFFLNKEIVKQARSKFHQAQKRYTNDLSDYVELQDARQDFIQSLAGLVNSYYEYFTARAALKRAVGE